MTTRAPSTKARQLSAARAMQAEAEAIVGAMVLYGGDTGKASLSLGITENLLKIKIKTYGLDQASN